MSSLPEILELLTPTEKCLLDILLEGPTLWMPHPENRPQVMAYVSEADVLYFGGAAGGGKSDLLEGLALTAHKKSIIFRREFVQLRELIDRSAELLANTKARYNQTFTRWTGIPGGRQLEFGAVQHEKFREKYKGRPHDFIGFDEIADFPEDVFRFLCAWNRSVDENQRCRIVCAGNPPFNPEGQWVISYWAPWLSPDHPNPAKPGELRYFVRMGGEEVEVPDGQPVKYKDELLKPASRTFIPAFLSDNPFLRDTNYEVVLQSLPEPLRSQLLFGDFLVEKPDRPQQVIPTEWVRAAQQRWRDREPPDLAVSVAGVDVSRGGKDKTEIARKAGNYFYELLSYPGEAVPDGPTCAALVVSELGLHEGAECAIHLDIIGVGSSVYDILQAEDYDVVPVNFAEGSRATDKSGQLKFRNIRAEAYWRLREDLDPTSGLDLALPASDELLADLTAPLWTITTRGITVESKEEIRKRLHRSPGKGDAIVLANFEPYAGVYFR